MVFRTIFPNRVRNIESGLPIRSIQSILLSVEVTNAKTNEGEMKMIRKQTVANAVAKIVALRVRVMEIEAESEAKYNFITEKTQAKSDSLNEQADKLQEDLIAKLTKDGLCTDEHGTGLTLSDSDNPFFADIDSLFEIGNGSWC